MNKAFVREPEEEEPRCPRCDAKGESVPHETLAAHLPAEGVQTLGNSAFFCPTAACEVVYFDGWEKAFLTSDLTRTGYPKDPAAPICPCFDFRLEDIDDDLRDGVPTRIRALLAQSKTNAAQCLTQALNGRCCLPEVQKIYFRRRQ